MSGKDKEKVPRLTITCVVGAGTSQGQPLRDVWPPSLCSARDWQAKSTKVDNIMPLCSRSSVVNKSVCADPGAGAHPMRVLVQMLLSSGATTITSNHFVRVCCTVL